MNTRVLRRARAAISPGHEDKDGGKRRWDGERRLFELKLGGKVGLPREREGGGHSVTTVQAIA